MNVTIPPVFSDQPARANWRKVLLWLATALLAGLGCARATEAPAPATGKPFEQGFPLTQIVLVENAEAANQPGPDATSFVVASGALKAFNTEELTRRLLPGKGRPIDLPLLSSVVQVVGIYIRQNDFPVADIVVPEQNIREGVLRLVVRLGKLREIKAKGNNWFSESVLQSRLGVSLGDTIRMSELERAIAWANNTNPFRQLKLHLEPIPNTGEYDLIIGVQDKLPLRLTASYDNSGNDILGYDRYTAGVTYGNMWGRDHQVSYQFTTSDKSAIFQAHGVSYQAPLKWRHMFQASASYVLVEPTFLDGYFKQRGESLVANARYVIPFKRQRWSGEISGSLGFRQTNNNLEFSGTPVLGATTDSIAAVLGLAAIREDTRGKWILSTSLTGSPGTFNSRSEKSVFEENRSGANPFFGHWHVLLQRATVLTPNLASSLRAIGQIASTNLLASEQFSVGGDGTVRGYKERILAGDQGYLFSHEIQLRLPSAPLGKRLPKLDLVGIAFWDYGRAIIKKPGRGQERAEFLSSCGVGLRGNISNLLSASVDYGRQLEEVEVVGEPHHRFHVKVSLSY